MCAFITEHREEFGVAPICRALSAHGAQIAPRTYFAQVARPPSKRALWDTVITEVLAGIYQPDERGRRPPECLHGSLKMWAYLQRCGIPLARCTVERLMRANGWRGVTRTTKVHTTVPDPAAARAPDRVYRHFGGKRPDQLYVADFTYVPMTCGFGYTAFVIDASAGTMIGWECSLSKQTAFVERAIREAATPLGRASTVWRDDPSLGCRFAVHRGAFRRDPAARGVDPLDRHRRRCPRQCLGRDHDRAVQDRVRPRRIAVSQRALAHPRRLGGDHLSVGALVQHRPAHAPPRPAATSRGRGRLLRSDP